MNRLIPFATFLFLSIAGHGQGFILKIGGGYSWPGLQNSTGVIAFQPGKNPDPANSIILPLYKGNSAVADSGRNYKANVYGGYGKGGHLDFGFGYMINPYFGVEIDGAYLWGSTVQSTQVYDDALLGASATLVTKTHAQGFSINPSLIFRAAKPTAKVAPYARLGLTLPVQGAIYHTLDINAPNFPLGSLRSSEIDIKTKPTVSVGFQGSIGVSYTPVPLITVFAEVGGQYLFLKADEAVVTKYQLNFDGPLGTQDMLGTKNALNGGKPYGKYSTTTHFVDELNSTSNTEGFGKTRDDTGGHNGQSNYVDETKAHDQLRQVANLGALGFGVGLQFNLSKKIFQDPLGKKAKSGNTPQAAAY